MYPLHRFQSHSSLELLRMILPLLTHFLDSFGVPVRPIIPVGHHLNHLSKKWGELHRWAIEAFFKQLKQTLQLCAFLGHSKKAIQWQVWTALLAYVLIRFLAHLSDWPHSFTRLFGLVRCSIWTRIDLLKTLRSCGTAGGDFRMLAAPEQAYLPGFAPT